MADSIVRELLLAEKARLARQAEDIGEYLDLDMVQPTVSDHLDRLSKVNDRLARTDALLADLVD